MIRFRVRAGANVLYWLADSDGRMVKSTYHYEQLVNEVFLSVWNNLWQESGTDIYYFMIDDPKYNRISVDKNDLEIVNDSL